MVSTSSGCVCGKEKGMGTFLASCKLVRYFYVFCLIKKGVILLHSIVHRCFHRNHYEIMCRKQWPTTFHVNNTKMI